MKCQSCSSPATVHLTDIINGQKKELHLCQDCAEKQQWLKQDQINLTGLLQSVIGQHIVAPIIRSREVLGAIRGHHERVDGGGYPDGLSGDSIPLACRVLHVADAFDAMISGRPYRRAVTTEEALQELQRNAGVQFDAQCVALLEESLKVSGAI